MAFYPPNGSCQELVMTANVQLDYPYSAGTSNTTVTDIIDVSATVANLKIILPNSQLTGPGFSIAFNNVGTNAFDIVLNDGITVLSTINPNNAITTYLYNNTTVNGNWRIVQVGGGVSAISSLTVESTDASINIVDGVVTSPSGVVDITLPSLISKITELSTFIPGIVAIDPNATSPWSITLFTGGNNISVENGDGATGITVIDLDDTISLTQITAGNIVVNNDLITNTDANGILNIVSNGANSHLNLNGILIDVAGNISNVGNITIDGTFKSLNTANAWCRFSNTSSAIAVLSAYNVSDVVYNSSNFQYTITFINPMINVDYGVFINCANNNSTPPLQTRIGYDVIRQLNSVTIVLTDAAGEMLQDIPEGVSVVIFSLN